MSTTHINLYIPFTNSDAVKTKNLPSNFHLQLPLPFSCQTNLLTKSPLQHSLYTRQPIFGCLGEMDRLLPVSYNWEVVDEMGKKRREKKNMGWNIVNILYTITELLPEPQRKKLQRCYSQKDFFSPYPVHGTPFSSSSLLLKRVWSEQSRPAPQAVLYSSHAE